MVLEVVLQRLLYRNLAKAVTAETGRSGFSQILAVSTTVSMEPLKRYQLLQKRCEEFSAKGTGHLAGDR